MQPTDRLHALDAVRAYALLLGVVLHTVAAYLEGFPMPLWRDGSSTTAAVIYYVIHMFRMSAFFLMAGFFARLVVERRGVKAFVKDRGKRIALPLVVGLPVVMITMSIALLLGALPHGVQFVQSLVEQTNAEAPAAAAAGTGAAQPAFNLVHLWFLYYLLIFYALALAARFLVKAVDPRGSIAAASDRVVEFVMRGYWAPVLIGLPIMLYHLRFDAWNEWLGLPAPFTLVPQMSAVTGYGVAFGLGWLLHRQIPLLLGLRRRWAQYLALALVLTVVCLGIGGVVPQWQGSSLEGTERLVYTAAYMTGLWCWVLAFVGAAVRFLSDPRPVTRYLADASYWVYLMHMSALLFFITLLRPYDWPWAIKAVIIIGGAMPILLLSYHYLVRFTWIGAILNGRRHPRPAKAPPADASAAPGS